MRGTFLTTDQVFLAQRLWKNFSTKMLTDLLSAFRRNQKEGLPGCSFSSPNRNLKKKKKFFRRDDINCFK
jgi:hypothetical protein